MKGSAWPTTGVDLGGTSPTAAVVNAATGDRAQCYLGLAVAGCVDLLDPEPVVLGGGVLKGRGEAYVERVRATAQAHYVNRNDLARVRIVRASLGDSSGAIGAAVLASRRLA